MAFIALFDACVLYPAPLRDLLMTVAQTGLFTAKWTDQIHEEWICNLLLNRPDLKRAQLERTKEMMNDHAHDALIDNYHHLIPALENLTGPKVHSGDRHVLAAAIVGRADVIVTTNLRHFPLAALAPYGIEPLHPDDFIRQLFDLDAAAMIAEIRKLRLRLKRPKMAETDYLDTLARQGLTHTVAYLASCKGLI